MVNNINSDIPIDVKEPNPAREALFEACRKADLEEKSSPFYLMSHTLNAETGELESKLYPSYDNFIEELDDGTKLPFKPAIVAKWFWENEHFRTDIKTGLLYFYDGRSWTSNGEAYLQKIVSIILGKEDRESHFRNILHALKGLTLDNIVFSQKIACENGLLDVETLEFKPFDPEEMPFHEIPVQYNPVTKCPNWEEFIRQVVNSDDILTLQEWSGYLLLPDYRFHKLTWIYGEGRNGKGVWQRTMEGVLGENNVSIIGLEEFDGNHRFALKQLHGKLFNPCSEPTTTRILQTPLLKHATGQDTIEAEIKGKQQRLQFRNTSKITVLANKFPRVNDQTVAFKERRLFIKFPKQFLGKDQIQNLETFWLNNPEEKSGILNWMLTGLQRLLNNGAFTESKTQQETEIEFQRHSDTVSAFINEMVIFDKNHVTTRTEAYDAYKEYCDILGLDTENDQKFTSRLKDTAKISVTTVSKPKKERAWKGFGLKTLDEDGKVTQVTTVTPLYPLHIFQKSYKEEESGKGVTAVTSVTETSIDNILPNGGVVSGSSAVGESSINYEQRNLALKIKPTKDARPCLCCESQASVWEISRYVNGGLESTFYNCDSCLREKTIPAYDAQDAKVEYWQAPSPTEETETFA